MSVLLETWLSTAGKEASVLLVAIKLVLLRLNCEPVVPPNSSRP
jgi:hypothetical protein